MISFGSHLKGIEALAVVLVIQEVPAPHAMEELAPEPFLEGSEAAHGMVFVLSWGDSEKVVACAAP